MGGQSANIGRINATSRHSWSSYTAPHTDQTTRGVRRTSQNWRIARPEGIIRCRTAWIQLDQGEGAFSGRAIKWSVGCEAQQGPRCRRCLSGRVTCATLCHTTSRYPLVLPPTEHASGSCKTWEQNNKHKDISTKTYGIHPNADERKKSPAPSSVSLMTKYDFLQNVNSALLSWQPPPSNATKWLQESAQNNLYWTLLAKVINSSESYQFQLLSCALMVMLNTLASYPMVW